MTSFQSIVLLASVHFYHSGGKRFIVHSLDHVDVKSFDESSIYQVSIGDDEWFYRFEFSYDSKRIAVSVFISLPSLPYA